MAARALTIRHRPASGDLPGYLLQILGQLKGNVGSISGGGEFTAERILLTSLASDGKETPVLLAVLPAAIGLPAGLMKDVAGTLTLRTPQEVNDELSTVSTAVKARFLALREEAFRRLRSIEVDWSQGAFLDARAQEAGGKVMLKGEAKLHLAVIAGKDPNVVAGTLFAEFRATVDFKVNVGGNQMERRCGLICLLRVDAAARMAFDIDDFNISLPEVSLPSLDLSTAVRLDLSSGLLLRVAGAFADLAEGFTATYTFTDAAVLVVARNGSSFYFAVMKSGLADDKYDLTHLDTANLAGFQAVVKHKDATVTLTVTVTQLAVHSGGQLLEATATAVVTAKVPLPDGPRVFGPLQIDWSGATLEPVVTATTADDPLMACASLHFERLEIRLVDDPSTVLALKGTIEITPSGTRIVELELIEPYPYVLVEKGLQAFARGAQKIIQLLGQIKPQAGDLDKLKRLLEVLGKIAAAVARAAVFVAETIGDVLAAAAELLAQALVKVAELLFALLKQLARLLEGLADAADVALDIELRIALDPLELRQVMITLSGQKIANATQKIDVLGVALAVPTGWHPALLIDFVTAPGTYLLAVRPSAAETEFASLSTDLWLKQPQIPTVSSVRDAEPAKGARGADPLITVTLKRKANGPLFIVIAGISRGKAVFVQYLEGSEAVVVREVPIPGGTQAKIAVVNGPFQLAPITAKMIDATIDFKKERVLPLLGMGEPGKETDGGGNTPDFLKKLKDSLGQVVWVERTKFLRLTPDIKTAVIEAELVLGVKLAGVSTQVTLEVHLDLTTLEVGLKGDTSTFNLRSRRIEEKALGLTWVVEPRKAGVQEANLFTLAFAGGETGLALTDEARMELRFDELSGDGQGVVLEVTKFFVGRGGLDLTAKVVDRAVRMNGINVPFRFTSGGFVIRAGKLEEATLAGRGQLPPDLVGEADCSFALTFAQTSAGIVLQAGKVELEKKGEPIVCHATRFTLTITDLDLAFVKDGGYHFFFLVTGTVRFTPKQGEFEDGLLKNLDELEIALERVPLTADPRVLVRHISFQKALNPKKTFSLFNLFTFEMRGFGFHPASPKFEDKPPAINLSGQIRFAQIGDVMQPSIDFHGLWMAPPRAGEALPRIKADGLGVDLQLAGAVKVRGSVLAVDPDTRTVEGARFAPPGYDTYGFLGEGALAIPGWGEMEASFGFLEVEQSDKPQLGRKLAFFLYLQKNKMAVQIPTPFWTFYMREAGFGFGYRFTLAGIKAAETATSAASLIRVLDDVSKRQGDLARFSAWTPDVEKDNFTLALRAAIQPYPAEETFDEARENEAESPFFFDLVAALRSDLTFLMSMRGWMGVNYATFLKNADGMREKPGLRGYLYISVPRSEILARFIADSKGFIGESWLAARKNTQLRTALESTDWSSTLYIRPGLFHFEMGWPDQLSVRLVDKPNMRVIVRGGMIFRAAEDGLLYGFNIGAEAFLKFEGRVGSSIGAAIRAELDARFTARLIAFLSWRLSGSLIYGLVALDARLTFAVEAWMEVDLGFKSFTIRIGFSFTVQFTAAVELAITTEGVGGRVAARIAVQAFGCTLSVGVGFAFNDRLLDAARARVQRFLAMSITAEEPDKPPVFAARTGDKAIESDSVAAEAPLKAKPEKREDNKNPVLKPSITKSHEGRDIKTTNFHLVLREATVGPKGAPLPAGRHGYALLVPRDAKAENEGGFYAAPAQRVADKLWERSEDAPVHRLEDVPDFGDTVWIFNPKTREFELLKPGTRDVTARWSAPISLPGDSGATFTLAHFFDECFLTDTEWVLDANNVPQRVAKKWMEPKELRIYGRAEAAPSGSREVRDQERERMQRDRAADAAVRPLDERAYQARATVMTLFLDQFVKLSATGEPDGKDAHVTDLGLVFFGPVDRLVELGMAKVAKFDATVDKKPDQPQQTAGVVKVFNPPRTWFDQQEPALADDCQDVEADGIKLNWRLQWPLDAGDPEQFLHYYEVLRTVEGAEYVRQPMLVKTGATIGPRDKDGTVKLCAADWQFTDNLGEESGVPDDARRALLPSVGEADAFEAGRAWIKEFGSRDRVSVTYSVTPVDIAGVRGLPRGFRVEVERPQPPIRPALAELRIVQSIAGSANTRQNDPQRPDDVELFVAISDPAWDDAADVLKTPQGSFTVERIYRLIVDPDDIEPAGHYGSNATTARVRGPGAWTPTRTADEKHVDIARSRTFDVAKKKPVPLEIQGIEEEKEDRERLPLWARLSDKKLSGVDKAVFPSKKAFTDFLDLLWKRPAAKPPDERRVATRFFLETIVRLTDGANESLEYRSKRTAVSVEHVVRVTDVEDQELVRRAPVRPDAFEWSVPLTFQPLSPGQVFAESGFAQFRVPAAGARLADLCANKGLHITRDPERRVLTTVRFAVVPALGTSASGLHAATIAGFDLHELDLDDLAALDTSGGKLAKDANAWRRARRVARIEQLDAQTAQLEPQGNGDWLGWQAHYPSATKRLDASRRGALRSAWYSDRETTPHFPERRPGLRLLPLPLDAILADLLHAGPPIRVEASLTAAKGTPAHKLVDGDFKKFPAITLQPFAVHHSNPDTGEVTSTGVTTAFENPQGFTPTGLRNLLLRLGWTSFKAGDTLLKEWLASPAAFDGLALKLVAHTKFGKQTEMEIPLPDLRSPVHPLLQEVLAELAFDARDNEGAAEPAIYRRYEVMTQPVAPFGSKDFEGFLAATAAGPDPYGWSVLQGLGCASTVRLYDRERDAFMEPLPLMKRIDAVMKKVLARWSAPAPEGYKPEIDAIAGQPFVEVHLRPGADRLAGPFDAMIDKDLMPGGTFDLDERGLAFAQISLRPAPRAVWCYRTQSLRWNDVETAKPHKGPDGNVYVPDEKKPVRMKSISLSVERRLHDVDVARAAGGPLARLTETTPAARLRLPGVPAASDPANEANPELELFFRVRPDAVGVEDRPRLFVFVEWEQKINEQGDMQPWTDAPIALTSITSPLASLDDWKAADEPAAQSGDAPDPFERFASLSVTDWTIAFGGKVGSPGSATEIQEASAALAALKNALRAVAPSDFAFPTAEGLQSVVGAYLPWTERFLELGAPRGKAIDGPSFALAAPIKATPWKLAADEEGYVTLSFLHSDRWAHARAYAVKPIARYHFLLSGLGVVEQAAAEALVNTDKPQLPEEIGYAVAVSPRTERIEPPVMLGSRMTTEDENGEVQIVVARHGEEGLAMSNRPLFARLGTPTSLLAFSRAYRAPLWPDRLKKVLVVKQGDDPTAIQLPARIAPNLVGPPADTPNLTGTVVGEIARDYPTLWKGADIWRVAPVPPHYKIVALASERAGVVVSDVTTVVQDDLPRRPLASRESDLFPVKPAATLVKAGETARLQISHRLLSHQDLTPAGAAGWITKKPNDVAWWPDPDVVYALSRRGNAEGETNTYIEEDAEIKLIPIPPIETNTPVPVVLNARGTRYAAVAGSQPIVSTIKTDERRDFTMSASLVPAAEADATKLPIERWKLTATEHGTLDQIKAFNKDALRFAMILTPHRLTIDLPVGAETAQEYVDRLTTLRDQLRAGVTDHQGEFEERRFQSGLLPALEAIVGALSAWITNDSAAAIAAGKTPAQLRTLAGLPFPTDAEQRWSWPLDHPFPFSVNVGTLQLAALAIDAKFEAYLVLSRIASDQEVAAVAASGPPVAAAGGRLQQRLAERIMGDKRTLYLRMIDGRARIVPGKPETPGVVEIEVKLPDWLEKALPPR